MLIIPENVIENVVQPDQLVNAMEKALMTVDSPDYFTPDRIHVDIQENTLLLMPSVGPDSYATKLVSVFPKNAMRNMDIIQGLVIFNDGETGKPLALLNGGKLTALRTAAVACVGVRYLTSQGINRLGIIGAGYQGRHLAWSASDVRNIQRIYVYDPSPKTLNSFKDFLFERRADIEVIVCKTVKELLHHNELILTATSSPKPVLPDDSLLLENKCFIGIGSYKPDMREFPSSLFSMVKEIWIDAEHGRLESGDLIYPIKEKLVDETEIKNVSGLINGFAEPDLTSTRLYKTVGLGIFDLFAARMIYDNCIKSDLGIEVEI